MSKSPPEPTLEEWKDGVWQFLLEHSDITEDGSIFIKFHTSNRRNLENRIKGRVVYNYARVDKRDGLNAAEKEQLHQKRQAAHYKEKKRKAEYWKADREERQRVMAEIKRQNERNCILNKYPPQLRPFINTLLDTYATARIKMLHYKTKVLSLVLDETTAQARSARKGMK